MKPTNILLDNEIYVKICYFGISTLIPTDNSNITTHTTTFGIKKQ